MGEISPLTGNPPQGGLTKRTYKPPRLYSYGTLRDITLTVGESGRFDQPATPDREKTHGSPG
jgi:hypothetical protein